MAVDRKGEKGVTIKSKKKQQGEATIGWGGK